MNKSELLAAGGLGLAFAGTVFSFWRIDFSVATIFLVLIVLVILSAVIHRYLVKTVGRISKVLLEIRSATKELKDSSLGARTNHEVGSESRRKDSSSFGGITNSGNRKKDLSNPNEISNRTRISSDSTQSLVLSPVPADCVEYVGSVHASSVGKLEKFALRNRSTSVRDSLAFQATGLSGGLSSLVAKLEDCEAGDDEALRAVETWNWKSVAALARVISNQRFSQHDLQTAEYLYYAFFALNHASALGSRDLILFSEILELQGKYKEAVALCQRESKRMQAPLQTEFTIANQLRRQEGNYEDWLHHVSAVYKRKGLPGLRLQDQDLKLSIDNLASDLAEPRTINGPKITVIVPTFEGATRIDTTLRSLVNQSWKNIEIIVVDDGSSPENTCELRDICGKYEDVLLLEQGENRGAYPARNLGLQHSTGQYVTVHDDDDWSHPEKLAIQVQYLIDNPKVKACVSRHIRVTEDMKFTRINSNPKYIQANYSSLMLERSMIEALGGWHEINRGADEEFKKRVERFGDTKVATVCPLPLSFTRTHDQSLTAGEISRGYQDPSRLFYHASFTRAHKKMTWPSQETVQGISTPANMRAGMRRKHLGLFDMVVAADFSLEDFQQHKVLRDARIAADNGLRVGLLNLFSPHSDASGVPSEETLLLAEHPNIEVLSLKDSASVSKMIVPDPSVLQFVENLACNLEVVTLAILWRESVASEFRKLYDESTVVRNAENLFPGVEIESFNSPGKRIWQSALTLKTESSSAREWRDIPVVGRYSDRKNSQKTMWPAQLSDIRAIYGQNSLWQVLMYGSAPSLSEKATGILSASHYVAPESQDFAKFLDSIDFWIPFGEEQGLSLVEGVLEAQASGKVVILPYRYRSVFGSSAIYSSPKNIAGVITRLWRDKFLYQEQADRGLAFVEKMWSPGELMRELTLS